MRFLHSAMLLRPVNGIVAQMTWEQQAADQLGLSWRTRAFSAPDARIPDLIRVDSGVQVDGHSKWRLAWAWVAFRLSYLRWLRAQDDIDVFVLRHSVHDPFQYLFIRTCPKPVYLVHHTKELDELAGGGVLGKLRSYAESVLGRWSIRRAAGVIGVTPELSAYESERAGQAGKYTYTYPNGVMYTGQIMADHRQDRPEFLFVASHFYDWHGLDLVLDALGRSQADFCLHIVGVVFEADLVRCQKDPRIVLHGTLSADEISALAQRCWVGLSSFALDRKGMLQACTLKVREYLMLGLPVYSGHQDVFERAFPFYCQGPVDVAALLDYAHAVRLADRAQVSQVAQAYIAKTSLLEGLTGALTEQEKARHS
ncbi:glycosyltransferase family protein [Alcaligenes aquatilis]|uniref:hypothetical protein n=1 Tax=Alcaligenes aquatilis TaxID=323284 RepID=UPI0038737712